VLANAELRVVFYGPPGSQAGRFVTCEDASGNRVDAGEWHERGDGMWELIVRELPSVTDSA